MLELENVSKSYTEGTRRRVVFSGLDIRFEAGSFSAIKGRSGSGKSTLLNLVSGIDVADAGRIVLDGTDLTALGDHERTLQRRHQIGFVFQFFNLVPTLTVAENLMLPLELIARPREAAHARVREMLDRVGLGDRADSFPDRLSGGEQQRVAVARALVHEPRLVLADEPTGNLDSRSAAEVLELLVAITRDGGHTLLMVTHSEVAADLADTVYTIEDGAISEVGAPASASAGRSDR